VDLGDFDVVVFGDFVDFNDFVDFVDFDDLEVDGFGGFCPFV